MGLRDMIQRSGEHQSVPHAGRWRRMLVQVTVDWSLSSSAAVARGRVQHQNVGKLGQGSAHKGLVESGRQIRGHRCRWCQ